MHRDYIVLDRSASMHSIWRSALEGTNAYVRQLSREKVNNLVTFITFYNEVVDIKQKCPASHWHAMLESKDFRPEGGTPLNDAIVATIMLAKRDEPETATILFVTDGEDTTSTQFSTEEAKEAIAWAKDKGWTILFIGAGFDPAAQAKGYGVDVSHFIEVHPSKIKAAMLGTASARAQNVREGKAIGYTEEQKLLLGGPA